VNKIGETVSVADSSKIFLAWNSIFNLAPGPKHRLGCHSGIVGSRRVDYRAEIGIILLFFIVVGVNSVLAELIWGMTIRTNWKNLLGHVFVLLILLVVVGVPSIVLNIVAPSLVTTIVLFIIYSFVDGLIAKGVAGFWEEKKEQETIQTLPA
jgi:hypothetical protein